MTLPTVTFTARNAITITMASSQVIADLPACFADGEQGYVPPAFPLVTDDALLTYHSVQYGSNNPPMHNVVYSYYNNFSYLLAENSYTTASQNGGQQNAYLYPPVTEAYGLPQALTDPFQTPSGYLDGVAYGPYGNGFYYETAAYSLAENNTGLAYVIATIRDGYNYTVVYDPAVCPNTNYPSEPYSTSTPNYSIGSLFASRTPSNASYLSPFGPNTLLRRSDFTLALGNQAANGNAYPIYTVNTVNSLGTYSTATIPGLEQAYLAGNMASYVSISCLQTYGFTDDYTGYLWNFNLGFEITGDVAFEVSNIDGTIETPLSLIQFDDNYLLQWLQPSFGEFSPQPIAVAKDLFIFGTPENYIMMDLRTHQYDVLTLVCDASDSNAITALSQTADSFNDVLAFGTLKAFAADGTLFALPYPYSGILSTNSFTLVQTAPSTPTIDRIGITIEFAHPLPAVPCCSLTCPC